jgi:hypothetical protein
MDRDRDEVRGIGRYCAQRLWTPSNDQCLREELDMRTIILGIASVSLVAALANTATARSHARHRHQGDVLAYRYPYATPRQLRNERAYQRGEYWEHDSNALIPGTRAWFEQKEREGGERRF